MKLGITDKAYKRLDEATTPYFAKTRRNRLERTGFSIISNNCWAGSVYRYYGLPYQSPTAGLYFFAPDYIKLCGDLRRYMSLSLEPLDIVDSPHRDELVAKGQRDVPLGLLGDIEVVFLHYPSFEEAREKWERRASRINYDDVFFKFSEMNHCGETELGAFSRLRHRNKVLFTVEDRPDLGCSVRFGRRYVANGEIGNDTVAFRRYFDLTGCLNSPPEKYGGGLVVSFEAFLRFRVASGSFRGSPEGEGGASRARPRLSAGRRRRPRGAEFRRPIPPLNDMTASLGGAVNFHPNWGDDV